MGLSSTAQQARHMYNGHHLGQPIGGGEEDFSYWRGPVVRLPESGTEQEKRQAQGVVNEFQTALRRSFTSTNFIKEFVNREVNSSVARMNWTLMQPERPQGEPEEGRTTLEKEADVLTKAWWRLDRNHPERAIRKALVFARREGRGVLRFRVAGGVLQQGPDGKLRVKAGLKLAQIARYIRLECVEQPENVAFHEDPDTFLRSAVYSYKDAAEKEAAEVCTVENDVTVLRVVKEGLTTEGVTRINLGGRLLLIELALEALITPQVLQNQMAYNTASTMILRNTELAGFMERYGIDVEPPFVLEQDPSQAEGMMRRRYLPLKVGAGHMTAWRTATYDKTDDKGAYIGEEPMGKGQYGRFEPVGPEALTAAADHNRLNLYGEVGQRYVLMGADATASGYSREVAIADVDTIRQPVIDLAEATITEVLETFLALVAALGNQAGRFESLQVDGQVKSRIVPPSATDRAADRADAQAGVISLQTARQRQGQDDPAQEDAQIERERQAGTSPTLKPQVPTPRAPEEDKSTPRQTRRRGRKAA